MPRLTSRTLALVAVFAFLCSTAGAQSDNEIHTVRLQDSGSLIGYTVVNWVSGKSEPVSASIELTQDGAPIATGQSDDVGNFKIDNLSPGDYHAFVTIDVGSAEFDLQLVDTKHGSYVGDHLTATMTPLPEGCGCEVAVNDSAFWTPTTDVIVEGYVDGAVDYQMDAGCSGDCGYSTGCEGGCGGGFACGGCGGGGALLGLGGLAGLAGLAGLDDDHKKKKKVVSPSHPYGHGHHH